MMKLCPVNVVSLVAYLFSMLAISSCSSLSLCGEFTGMVVLKRGINGKKWHLVYFNCKCIYDLCTTKSALVGVVPLFN